MGFMRDEYKNSNHWITKYDFQYTTNPVAGPSGTKGYERGYYHHNDLEYLRICINFDIRKVYLYNEYDCGGLLWEEEYNIPDTIDINDENEFIDWLENEVPIES